jgi:predicted outer membrane repeat protein
VPGRPHCWSDKIRDPQHDPFGRTPTFPPRPDANAKVPVFIDCVFRENTARGRGGAVSNDLGTSPIFLNCVFDRNSTPQKGGGMYNDFGCSPVLINCLFTGNSAESAGGMGNDGASSPILLHCTFTKNHAQDYGAPLYQGTGPSNNPVLIACVIADNTCDWESPGIYNWHDNTPVIKDADNADAGHRPGLFTEAQLPQLLRDLNPYQVRAPRSPSQKSTEQIPSSSRVVYADLAAAPEGGGQSWATAHTSLQAAIDDAGQDGAEVRVAAGTYRLGSDRTTSFVLRPGVRVLGGYRGDVRDPEKTPTVLDGNRAYHVVIGANGTTLDGLTITGGHADGAGYDGKGGGLITYRRAPQDRPGSPNVTGFAMTINRVTFTHNYARDGGAIYSYDRAKCVFTACIFSGNRAENGGAVLDRVGVESIFKDCEFTGNSAQWHGGAGYFDYGARPRMTGCVFRRNTAGGHGGAIFSASRASQLESTVVALTDCRLEGNTAKGYGGAANFHDNSVAAIANCTFGPNTAGLKGDAVALTGNSSWQSGSSALTGPGVYQAPARARPTAPAR